MPSQLLRSPHVFGASLVAIALATPVAHAKGAKPAWCKVEGSIEQGFMDQIRKDDDAPRAVIAIAYQKCNPDQLDDKDVADLEAGFKRMSTRLELTDAEWADMAQFATTGGDLGIHPIDAKAKWSGLAPIDQYAYLQAPAVEVPGLSGETDPAYVADAFGAHLSELGRLSYIDRCLNHQATSAEMAMCQPDIDAFDMHKIVAELRADKTHPPAVRAILRLVADRDRALFPARRDAIKKLIAKDSAYAKLFEIAAAQRKEWATRWTASADLISVVDAMDDAMVSNSRKATEGCRDKTWDTLKGVIATLPAKTFAIKRNPDRDMQFVEDVMAHVVETVLGDPRGFLAASAYTQCMRLVSPDKEDHIAAELSGFLARWPGYRGPRTSTHTAIFLAGIEFDDRADKIGFPDIERLWFQNSHGTAGGTEGPIESAKASGATTVVSFPQKLVKQYQPTGCSFGHRVVGVRDNGSIEYEYNCTGSKMITVDRRPPPQTVQTRFATGLKAGNVVAINNDVVWMAWPKADAATPSFVLGQPVK